MQSEKFDDKIRQAADQHHPNYDEKAWTKMEKLLDKELPQKKDRRRIIFFLLFFLLLGGGMWMFISKPWQQEETASTKKNLQNNSSVVDKRKVPGEIQTENVSNDKEQNNKPATEPTNKNTLPNDIDINNSNIVKKEDRAINARKNIPVASNSNRSESSSVKSKVKTKRSAISDQDQFDMTVSDPAKGKKTNRPTDNRTSPAVNNTHDTEIKAEAGKKQTDEPADTKAVSKNKVTEIKAEEKSEPPKDTDEKTVTQKAKGNNKNKKSNSFFFSFSAGPDVSYIGLDNPGRLKLLAGAGIGYSIKNKLTIRTGFYTATKVYTASKYDYKPTVPPPPTYLEKIDANCRVYEIPLSLAYNFGKSEKQNTFVSAGLSSFIMKKETYDYVYLYPSNPNPYIYTHKEDNKYKHYFSVLTLSGGYQRRINKVLSLSAEPYIKLPLGGVGYGKVKLKSAGILFSANIKPFN